MSEIKRYIHRTESGYWADDNGDWCRWNDIEELAQDYDKVISECDKLKKDIELLGKIIEQENERLREALDGLLDGLDANADEREGLTNKQWVKRIKEARQALKEDK